jgi:hypothetical protein
MLTPAQACWELYGLWECQETGHASLLRLWGSAFSCGLCDFVVIRQTPRGWEGCYCDTGDPGGGGGLRQPLLAAATRCTGDSCIGMHFSAAECAALHPGGKAFRSLVPEAEHGVSHFCVCSLVRLFDVGWGLTMVSNQAGKCCLHRCCVHVVTCVVYKWCSSGRPGAGGSERTHCAMEMPSRCAHSPFCCGQHCHSWPLRMPCTGSDRETGCMHAFASFGACKADVAVGQGASGALHCTVVLGSACTALLRMGRVHCPQCYVCSTKH